MGQQQTQMGQMRQQMIGGQIKMVPGQMPPTSLDPYGHLVRPGQPRPVMTADGQVSFESS